MITSRDNEKLKLVRKLGERRWRDKLGLFVCEGEDLVAAATAEPVELLVAGENVEPALLAEVSSAGHPPRVIGVYRRADLPAPEPRPAVLALWRRLRSRERRHADPDRRRLRRRGRAVGRLRRSDRPEGAPGHRRRDLARAAAPVPRRRRPQDASLSSRPAGRRSARRIWTARSMFLLGAEREGLPREVERDLEVTIPIGSESLNVAAAGAIALYEWRRRNPL